MVTTNQKLGFQVQEHYAEVGGDARLRYLSAGSGPPLVLLHGLLGYSFSWRWVMPELSTRATVYTPDMLGFGFSDRPRDRAYDLISTAHRLLYFLDLLSVDSCDLLGTSYGGAVALMAAALAPERFRKLILVDSVNPWSSYGKHRIDCFSHPAAGVFASFPWLLWPARRYFLKRLYGDPARTRRDTLQGYEAALRVPGTIDVTLQILRTWKQDLRLLEQSLPAIAKIPALLIWGELDRAVDPASAKRLAQVFEDSRLVMLPGVGHLPYEESPQDFLPPMIEFLTSNLGDEAA